MNLQLSEKAAIVQTKVVGGGYPNAPAYISDIILRANEFDSLKLNQLRQDVNIGLNEIKRHEVVEFNLEEIFNTKVE